MISSQIDPQNTIYPPARRLSQDDAEFMDKVQRIIGGLDKGYLRDTCRTEGCNNKLEKAHHYCPVCITAREMTQDREYWRRRAVDKVLLKLKSGRA